MDAGRIADAIDGFDYVFPPSRRALHARRSKLSTPLSFERSTHIKLLSSVDFHPLSINLLAQAAVQNEWSPQDLVAAWDCQRSLLLEGGDGKIQSIAVTIETSINSPSVVRLGNTIRHLLDVIAYLPQGLNKRRLMAIFPDGNDIEVCTDVLCKHSLAYLNGDFITLLAPIRLYFAKRYTDNISDNPLLKKVQRYYKDHYRYSPVIRTDHINMEHVFAHLVNEPEEMIDVLRMIGKFVHTLIDNEPHPTSLLPVIMALDPSQARSSVTFLPFFKGLPKAQQRMALVRKGECLRQRTWFKNTCVQFQAIQ
ncbi:hypothetical protein H0H92_015400 [Tricholoma furcatifolium]|nr:hypothetical protein H0H92_015400 [Tricholoma furcatifolium]